MNTGRHSDSIEGMNALDATERDILEVVVSALNDTYDCVDVYCEASKEDPKSQDTMISLLNVDLTHNTKERVTINFTQRQVRYRNHIATCSLLVQGSFLAQRVSWLFVDFWTARDL